MNTMIAHFPAAIPGAQVSTGHPLSVPVETALSACGAGASNADKLSVLRRMMAEKFPSAEARPGGILPTGLHDLDAEEGGLRRAAVTELAASSGTGALFIRAMLKALQQEAGFGALVDASRSFAPDIAHSGLLQRLLVVFCPDAMKAVKATDLVLRDGNLALVLLDLQGVPLRQLQRIPPNAWHRLQRLAEQTTAAMVVLTPFPIVEAAQVRITARSRLRLHDQRRYQHEIVAAARWKVFLRRSAVRGDSSAGKEQRTATA